MPTNKIKIGKIELEPGDNTSQYIPKGSKNFIDHGDILKTLAIGIRDNLAVIMIGESGTGKTSAIRHLAEQTGNGLRRVNLNGGTTADELIGRLLINDKGTYWVDGVLTEAMRKGEWIVLDEINAALPEVLFVLQSIMDDDGYLVLQEKDDKEIIRKHKNFRLFATCNPPEYAGTKEMNKALLSRFAICINAEFPPKVKEMEIIEHHLGNAIAKSEIAISLVEMANETREAKESGTADYAINTRDILNTLKLVEHMDPVEALSLSFANKLDSADMKAIKTMSKLHLPSNKTKLAQRTQLKNVSEIKPGNTYIMGADLHDTFYGLTDDKTKITEWEKNKLGTNLKNLSTCNAIKGNEFKVDKIFYEKGQIGATDKEKPEFGTKVASIISFTKGKIKGQSAILPHHPKIGDSIKTIENMYEITQ